MGHQDPANKGHFYSPNFSPCGNGELYVVSESNIPNQWIILCPATWERFDTKTGIYNSPEAIEKAKRHGEDGDIYIYPWMVNFDRRESVFADGPPLDNINHYQRKIESVMLLAMQTIYDRGSK